MTNKLATIIVVNWNGRQHLEACFSSLLKQDYPALEILMVDNASSDGSVEFVRELFPEVTTVQNNANIGFGPAVNRGMAAGKGDYFLFLNNDLSLNECCLSEMVRKMEERDAGAVIPKILFFEEEKRDMINSFGVDVNYTGIACPRHIFENDRESLKEYETHCGGIFMLSADMVRKTGGFDESIFFYHEDHDLSWRIRLAGKKLIVNPKAIIYHKYHFGRNKNKFYQSEKNRLYILLKNYSLKTLILIAPAVVLVEFAQIIFSITHGWFINKIKSYFEILVMIPTIFEKRAFVQRNRIVPDSEIVRLMQGKIVVGGIKHPLLDNFLSPLINFYWKVIKRFI